MSDKTWADHGAGEPTPWEKNLAKAATWLGEVRAHLRVLGHRDTFLMTECGALAFCWNHQVSAMDTAARVATMRDHIGRPVEPIIRLRLNIPDMQAIVRDNDAVAVS